MAKNRDLIVEFLTIGREILDGRVVDTNSVAMAEEIGRLGLIPRHAQRVDDQMDRIVEAFRLAHSRSDIVLVTGGLGPTSDDMTAEAFARFLGEKVELNREALMQIEAYVARLGRLVTMDAQKKQAMLPPSCFVLPNPEGTAPGFALDQGGKKWFFMPGVPREMIRMLREQVIPRLPKQEGYRSVTWLTQFTAESQLQSRMNPIEAKLLPGFEITYRTKFPENHIGLHGVCHTNDEKRAFDQFVNEITTELGHECFAQVVGTETAPTLEKVVFDELHRLGDKLVTVESCTGGLIAQRFTEISGASKVFLGSFVTYWGEAKSDWVGVSPELIRAHGEVSAEVARALAEGALSRAPRVGGRTWVITTTGIAGPTGGTEQKPVGLCYVGLANSDGLIKVQEIRGRSALDRARMRTFFAQKAFDLLREALLHPSST